MLKRIVIITLITCIALSSISYAENAKDEIISQLETEIDYYLQQDEFDLFGRESGKILTKYANMYGVKGSIQNSIEFDKATKDLQVKILTKTLKDNGYIYSLIVGAAMLGVGKTLELVKKSKTKKALTAKLTTKIATENDIFKVMELEEKLAKMNIKRPLVNKRKMDIAGRTFLKCLKLIFK